MTKSDYDVVIVGAGPAGVAAAISLPSEGWSTVVLDARRPGGQVATSSLIENVFGAGVRGKTGSEFMSIAIAQASAFGAHFLSPFRAVRLMKDPLTGCFTIRGANRETITATAVVLALGASFRRLDTKGVSDFYGRGVDYGAPQYQVPDQWIGKRVGIVGGGNSAGQAALFLSQCAGCQVHIFIRGESLEADMSHYLIKKVKGACKSLTVHGNTTLKRVDGNDVRMENIIVDKRGEELTVPLDYLLVQIGAEPQTGWLEGIVLDERGYILTDRDIPAVEWPSDVGRPAFAFETSMPGVFAGGDAHAGAPRRMQCAIGEGAALAVSVGRYLHEREHKLQATVPAVRLVAG